MIFRHLRITIFEIMRYFIFLALIVACSKNAPEENGSSGPLTHEKKTFKDISYVDDTLFRHKMDIHIPGGLNEPAPLVVYIHGGGFRAGRKGNAMRYCDSLYGRGYVIADINYRLSQDSIFPALIYDCKTAIRFLKLNAKAYGIDTSRIGVMGHSAGGHLSAFLGSSNGIDSLEGYHLGNTDASGNVHAVMDFFGPTDFLQMDKAVPLTPPDSCEKFMVHDVPDSPESQLLGCLISDCPERVKQANPITYVDGNEPPFAIHHGSFDCLVPHHQSTLLYNRLKEVNAAVEYVVHPHVKHGGGYFSTPEMKETIATFFDRTLRK